MRWSRLFGQLSASISGTSGLCDIIDATPTVDTDTFLVTQYGKSFTAPGFGNKMAEWCKEAGLSASTRTASARRRRRGRPTGAQAPTR